MEGKVNTCRSFDPDLEREGGGKKKKKKRKGRKKKYSSTSSFVTHPRLPTCLEWNVRSLPLPLSSPLSTRCLAHHDGRPRFRRGVKRQRRGTRHARRFKGRGRGEGERGGGRPDFRVSYSPLNCTPTRKTNSSTWNVSQWIHETSRDPSLAPIFLPLPALFQRYREERYSGRARVCVCK